MRKDPTEFRKRFAAWKDGKKPYEAGLPVYKKGKTPHEEFVEQMGPVLYKELLRTNTPNIDTAYDHMLRQLAYESDYGRSRVARQQHNYGGYGWNGKTYTTFKDDEDFVRHYVLLMNDRYGAAVNADSVQAYGKALKDKGYYEDTLANYTRNLVGMKSLSRSAAAHRLSNPNLYQIKPLALTPVAEQLESTPQFQPVNIVAPEINTDYSLLNASIQSPTPQSINVWKGKGSPAYGGYSLRMPSIQEYMLTGNIMPRGFKDGKLPEYYLGRNGVQEEKTDATTVNRPIIILPIKRDFIAEAQRKHAAEAIGPDNRSSYQRKLVQRAKLYANQQYQKTKDDAKRAEGLELMMKTISPSTYVEAATGLDLGTVGRFVTDAAIFGLPSALKYGISKALTTPILGKWVYKIPENTNMAYRIMGPLERDWLMLGNELSTRATNIATKAEEVAARTKGRFNLYKAGAEHGGRKQFAKGQPWHANTTTHGEKQVLAIPGEDLPWISGKHYNGPQGHGWGVGDVSFDEVPFGSHIDLMTDEAGFSGINPSLLPGSVIYSPFHIFGKKLGYKILNLNRSKLASRVPGLKIHSLEHPLDSWIHTPEKQSYIRFPYSASWDDFLTDPKLGKYFTEGGEAEVYESFNNPGYLTKVKLKIPEEGTTLEDLEYAVNRDLKINELPGTEPIVYKGFSTPEIIRRSLNQDTRFVSDEFVPIWELRKLTPTDKVNFEAFNVDPEQIVNDFASDFGYRYNPDGSWQFGKIKLSDLGIKNFAYDSFGNLKFIDPMIQGFKDGKSPIHIKPSHRGKLTALKKRTGKSEEELYNDGNPAHKKMVVFARNARKWKH